VLNKLFKNRYGGEYYPDENNYNEYNSMEYDFYEVILIGLIVYVVVRIVFYLFG
jgi:hypothetical protein